MEREELTETIIRLVTKRCITELSDDPRRTVRKMVDLGEHFARGRFQKQFFDLSESILSDENSLYYEMISRAVRGVDLDTLETFGFNIGYGSWTKGARLIREREAAGGYGIPWALAFRLDGNKACNVRFQQMLSEGKGEGIQTYLLFIQEEAGLRVLLEAALLHPDCAFVLFATPKCLVADSIQMMKGYHNLAILVEGQGEWLKAAELLSGEKCLFGVYRIYEDAAEAQELLSGGWLTKAVGAGCTFAVSIAGKGCTDHSSDVMGEYVFRYRAQPLAPVFLIDLYSDYRSVSKIISHKGSYLEIAADSSVMIDGELATRYDGEGLTLREILCRNGKWVDGYQTCAKSK